MFLFNLGLLSAFLLGSSCCQHPQKHPDVTESLQNPPDDDEQGVLVMEGDVEADRKRGDARKGNKARIGGAAPRHSTKTHSYIYITISNYFYYSLYVFESKCLYIR